jgi:hypothetical protein
MATGSPRLTLGVRSSQSDPVRVALFLLFGSQGISALVRDAIGRSILPWWRLRLDRGCGCFRDFGSWGGHVLLLCMTFCGLFAAHEFRQFGLGLAPILVRIVAGSAARLIDLISAGSYLVV